MAYEFRITRRVEFSETDMAGIVHFANFFRYMESTEHAFFRSLGHSVVLKDFDPPLGLPRVHASCDYLQPLKFEDEFEVQLLVAEKRSKTLSYVFRFTNLSAPKRVEVARGRVTVVCVKQAPDGTMKSADLPVAVSELVEAAPQAMLRELLG